MTKNLSKRPMVIIAETTCYKDDCNEPASFLYSTDTGFKACCGKHAAFLFSVYKAIKYEPEVNVNIIKMFTPEEFGAQVKAIKAQSEKKS